MRETLLLLVQPIDSHGATLRSSISRTRQRAVGAQAVEDVGAELLVELPPLARARA